ncbi:MAG: hypothetical protein LM590_02915 [Thermofilum sp.]|nr:hypothetical protein [Thermofilum sp.]
MLSTLVTGATGLFSVSKLYNFSKSLGYRTSKAKLIEYVECARQAYLVLLSEIYSPTIRNRKQYPKKSLHNRQRYNHYPEHRIYRKPR